PAVLRENLDTQFAMTPWRAAAIVAYLAVANSALEELHSRAWLDRELSARWGNAAGMLASAATFGAMHLFIFTSAKGVTPPTLAAIFGALVVMGLLWSGLMRRPGGIHAAWFCHGLTDAGFLTWGLFWLGYFST